MNRYQITWTEPDGCARRMITDAWKFLEHGWLQVDGAGDNEGTFELFPPGLTSSINFERTNNR